MKRVLLVFGTRPEAIKMCPLYLELKQHDCYLTQCLVTGQHRDMLDGILGTFAIVPDEDLNIMTAGQTVTSITTRILESIEQALLSLKPDLVLVHGDTTTAFVTALACFYHQIRVGHVEAGMRSFDDYSPYPEEMNRKLIADLADLHFAATASCRENLIREGVDPKTVFVTGNTVIDALKHMAQKPYDFAQDAQLKGIDFEHKRVLLLTCHRREVLGDVMRGIFSAIKDLLAAYPDIEVIFPIHKNPAVRSIYESVGIDDPRMHLLEPMEYNAFIHVMKRSALIITDSGGIQEEAPYFGVPVVVVRDVTERMEAVEAGTVVLAGTAREDVFRRTAELLDDPKKYQAMSHAVNPYGDGFACRRIVESIDYHFALSDRFPEEFGRTK